MRTPAVTRGAIYWVSMDPTVGAEIKKLRPALVVSNDVSNKYSPLVTILPITSNTSKTYPFEVAVPAGTGGLAKASVIKANQIRTIDKQRIQSGALADVLNAELMGQVEQAIKIHLGF